MDNTHENLNPTINTNNTVVDYYPQTDGQDYGCHHTNSVLHIHSVIMVPCYSQRYQVCHSHVSWDTSLSPYGITPHTAATKLLCSLS